MVAYSGQAFLPEVLKLVTNNARNQWKSILVFYKEPLSPPAPYKDLIEGEKGEKEMHDYSQTVPESRALLKIFSKPGDLVLDCMCGSGTTLVAALLEKRKAIEIVFVHQPIELDSAIPVSNATLIANASEEESTEEY